MYDIICRLVASEQWEVCALITIKTPEQIEKMRESGRIVAGALAAVEEMIIPGIKTAVLNRIAYAYILSKGATPSFLGYRGYPASINVSVNSQVIHGIPGDRRLLEGDIVSVDIGAFKNGYHGDAARTFAVGKVSAEAMRLIETTRESFFAGLTMARAGCHLYEISTAIQQHVESKGYNVVRDFIGHGIGKQLHEAPDVPNYRPGRSRGPKLYSGMTLAIEPMVNAGGFEVAILDDGWTVESADGSLSAHYENTVVITDGDPEILTLR